MVDHALNYTSIMTEVTNFKMWYKVYYTLTNEPI